MGKMEEKNTKEKILEALEEKKGCENQYCYTYGGKYLCPKCKNGRKY